MTPYLLHHFLEKYAQATPEQWACIHGDEVVTYSEMERQANRVAHMLRELGVRRGDRVGLLIENSSTYIAAYYGILKCGAVTVAMFTSSVPRTLAYILNDCDVLVLLTQSRHLNLLAEARQQLPKLRAVVLLDTDSKALETESGSLARQEDATSAIESGNSAAASGTGSIADHDANDWPWQMIAWQQVAQQPDHPLYLSMIDLNLASIIYTSGSTGDPRGAVLSHLNIMTNTRSIVNYLGLTREDRIMVVMPFPYVYGKSLLNTHFAVGGTVIIDNRFVFPNLVLRTMQEKAATGFSGVPSTYAILLGKSAVRKMEFPALRYLTQAGGAMAPALIREVMEVFQGKKVFIMYGATEASARLSYLPPEELPRKIGSIGKAIPNVELRIIKDNGEEAAPGEVGEIVARGANIMQGYWNQPEETRAVLTHHGFHTGDLGRMDEEGFFYVVGRKRDMIKSGGYRVSAKEIEEILLEHENILETAVIGIPDQFIGEVICAYIVPKNGVPVPDEEIISYCRERLPDYKVPRRVIMRDSLPKNASGKIMKEQLRKEVSV
ncbi:MAG: acyl--CoA ligase [candidate division KSB1 bacterium]|nr:acyl--CoA ligase [candidate division KSB1 bacterium]MDZ7302270.1 acyl--CoA ligase [candidate division KSB1 bacterium]MDZ7311376.1 acyl--CoA ligase [candidate division KSB1 bacterium]